MKKSRFSERQITFELRLAEQGTPAVGICRKCGLPTTAIVLLPGSWPISEESNLLSETPATFKPHMICA